MSSTKHLVIGIAGGSGSGKTTFLRALLNHFSPAQIALVSQDNYYKPNSKQEADANGVINYDLPTSIDRDYFYRDMASLKAGNAIHKLEYNFNNPQWKPKKVVVQPARVIVMEGLFIFHYEEIKNQLDFKVYIDAQEETRLERRIRRDAEERGYPEHEVRYQWHNHVRPAEISFLEPHKADCELIVDNTHSFDNGISHLFSVIQNFLDA